MTTGLKACLYWNAQSVFYLSRTLEPLIGLLDIDRIVFIVNTEQYSNLTRSNRPTYFRYLFPTAIRNQKHKKTWPIITYIAGN